MNGRMSGGWRTNGRVLGLRALGVALAGLGVGLGVGVGAGGCDRETTPRNAQATSTGDAAAEHGLVCPMHCEAGVKYADRTTCPVCGMALLEPDRIAYSVQLVPVTASVDDSGAGVFRARVIDPLGREAKGGWSLSPRAYVADHAIRCLTPIAIEPRPAELALPRVSGGLNVLVGRVSGEGREEEPFAAIYAGTSNSAEAGGEPEFIEDWDQVMHVAGYEVRIRCNGEPYTASTADERREFPLRISLQRDGRELALDRTKSDGPPEVVFVSTDRMTAVMARPAAAFGDPMVERAELLSNGHRHDLIYGVSFPRPGLYRGFVTLMHEGRTLPVAFTIDAKGDGPIEPHDHSKHIGK